MAAIHRGTEPVRHSTACSKLLLFLCPALLLTFDLGRSCIKDSGSRYVRAGSAVITYHLPEPVAYPIPVSNMYIQISSLNLLVATSLFWVTDGFATTARPPPSPSSASATPSPASVSRTAGIPMITPAPQPIKRCEGDACYGNTEGGEQPIAVTTTVQTTVLVPCTTYVTVTNDITTTLTSWSTEIQTTTMTVSDTVSIVVMSPTPDIKSTVVTQSTNIAWSYTSYWTEGPAGGPVTSTIQGGQETVKPSKPYESPAQSVAPVPVVSTDCQTCGYQSPAPTGWQSPTTAWTHTSAGVYVSSEPAESVNSAGWSGGPAQPFDPASRFTGGAVRKVNLTPVVVAAVVCVAAYVVMLL